MPRYVKDNVDYSLVSETTVSDCKSPDAWATILIIWVCFIVSFIIFQEDKLNFKKLNKVSSPVSKTDEIFSQHRFSAELKKNFFFLSRSIP